MLRALSLLALACAATFGAAHAQEASLPSYDVELVIFQRLAADATPEQWSMESDLAAEPAIPNDEPSPFDSDVPPPSPAATTSFAPLPAPRFKLTAIEDTLRRSRNYRPLAHVGWTQPGFARNSAQFVAIDGLVPAESGLSGKVALTRGRYLHLTLDLGFEPAAADGGATHYVLRQSRRMRSNERDRKSVV